MTAKRWSIPCENCENEMNRSGFETGFVHCGRCGQTVHFYTPTKPCPVVAATGRECQHAEGHRGMHENDGWSWGNYAGTPSKVEPADTVRQSDESAKWPPRTRRDYRGDIVSVSCRCTQTKWAGAMRCTLDAGHESEHVF